MTRGVRRVEQRPFAGGTVDVPVWSSLDLAALLLAIAALVAVFRFKAGTLSVLASCAAIGVALRVAGIA